MHPEYAVGLMFQLVKISLHLYHSIEKGKLHKNYQVVGYVNTYICSLIWFLSSFLHGIGRWLHREVVAVVIASCLGVDCCARCPASLPLETLATRPNNLVSDLLAAGPGEQRRLDLGGPPVWDPLRPGMRLSLPFLRIHCPSLLMNFALKLYIFINTTISRCI